MENMLFSDVPFFMDKYKVPGLSIGIIANGNNIIKKNYGFANIASQEKIHKKTIFQMASISKSLTAWAVLKLMRDKQIDLNQSVNHYLKQELKLNGTYGESVTVGQLLNHTSGLSMRGFLGHPSDKILPTIEECISGMAYHARPLHVIEKPGRKFRYSGGGYLLLQYIIQAQTDREFSDYLNNDIMKPLGMINSSFEYEDIKGLLACSYGLNKKPLKNRLYCEKAPAGLYSSLDDMLVFVSHYFEKNRKNNPILSEDNINALVRRGLPISNTGLGCFLFKYSNGQKIVWHNGINPGYCCKYAIIPETGDAIVIMTNSDSGKNVISEIMHRWLQTVVDAPVNYYLKKYEIKKTNLYFDCIKYALASKIGRSIL